MIHETSLRALRATLLLAVSAGCLGESKPTTGLCASSTPILDDAGAPTGFERCADGTVHRASAEATSPDIDEPACEGTESNLQCTTDADCTAGPYGKCVHEDGGYIGGRRGQDSADTAPPDGCGCVYACATDADCSTGFACIPPGVVEKDHSYAACEPAGCKTDADCAGGECALTSFHDGCSYETNLACRTAEDPCRVDADCTEGGYCASYGDDEIDCRYVSCAIGRPLLVDGAPRTAGGARRADWVASVAVAAPPAALAPALAAHWRGVAALEHASVASFSRFSLQLMALGAPPDLLAEVQAAAADEIGHARLAFGLASAFSGEAVGPGPLPLADLTIHTDRRAVIRALIVEACVGETLGAAEARAAAEATADPALAALLRGVAEDEARHAALAWRTLTWLVAGDASLQAFAAEILSTTPLPEVGEGVDLPAHGLLGAATRRALYADVFARVVQPVAAAALGQEIASRAC